MRYWLVFALVISFLSASSQADSVQTRVILVGDAGALVKGQASVLDAIKKTVKLDKKTVLVYLGDNLYDAGLPSETFNRYSDIKAALDSQINLIKGTQAKAYMIPGNHDWENGGVRGYEAILRQQLYVDQYGNGKVEFYPKGGCPGPVEVDISDDVVLVIMDSQWWIHSNDKPGIESDCEFKTEDEVIGELEDILNKNYKKAYFISYAPSLQKQWTTWRIFYFQTTFVSFYRNEVKPVHPITCIRFGLSNCPQHFWYAPGY